MLIIEEDKKWIFCLFVLPRTLMIWIRPDLDPQQWLVDIHRIQKFLNQQCFISKEHDEFICDLFGESVAHDDHVRHVGRDTQHNAQH